MNDFETAKSDLTAAENAVMQGVTRAASTYTAPALAAAAAAEAKVASRPWLIAGVVVVVVIAIAAAIWW